MLRQLEWSRALVALLAIVMLATTVKADEEPEDSDTANKPPAPFNPREAVAKVAAYQASHPEFAAGIATWVTTGLVLFVTGTAIFLYSEIQAMLVVRDQDFRKRLVQQNYMEEGVDIQKLNTDENVNMKVRPYISLVGTLLMFMAIACMLYPLCDVITVLGLPATPCILIVTFGSFFAALCVATFWMFLIWMCTRTPAALVFLVISLTGQILIPSGNPILLLLWMTLAFGGGWAYFFWLPAQYDKKEDVPSWLQDVGNFEISYQPTEMMGALEAKLASEASRYKPEVSSLGARDSVEHKSV